MSNTVLKAKTILLAGILLAGTLPLYAAESRPEAGNTKEYFVGLEGDDENDGLSRATAFATVQHGVDALEEGDTLTILPGEYFGAVSREKLGGPDVDTVIRAEIPGTVILRGDMPLPQFRKLDGYRNVYAAEFKTESEIQGVNEQDSLIVLGRVPNIAELDFSPGMFYHDSVSGMLFLSPPDFDMPAGRRYTVALISGSVMALKEPQRVHLEGLTVTGAGRRGSGIFLDQPDRCVIRDCRAYFNPGNGFYISTDRGGTGNLIERCTAWANVRGFMYFCPNNSTVRDSQAFLNANLGFWMYGGPGSSQGTTNRVEDCLAWGNPTEYELKAAPVQEAVRCVGPGVWSEASRGRTVKHSLIGKSHRGPGPTWRNNLILEEYQSVNPDAEFADPVNHDYRLQATSGFRSAGTNGADLGPFTFATNIYYLATNGNDRSDGLSVSNAWATLARAAGDLRPGDTLYIAPGSYAGDVRMQIGKVSENPVWIRGRGTGTVELTGNVLIENSHRATFERLRFTGAVAVSKSGELVFEQCAFTGGDPRLSAKNTDGLRIIHCNFIGDATPLVDLSGCRQVFLAGNRFENAAGAAVAVDRKESVLFADYNSYRQLQPVWRVGSQALAIDRLPRGWERYGSVHENAAGAGLYGRPAGNYSPAPEERARLHGPLIHAVGATSANVEWFPSRATARSGYRISSARIKIAWGATPDCDETLSFDTGYYGGFGLTNLTPSTRYYVRISEVQPSGLAPEGTAVEWNQDVVSFQTAAAYPAPVTYYVATNGNDAASGLSLEQPLRTLSRASALVRPGDTVLIAGGTYTECLYARATGVEGRPITFAAMPGERVVLDGDAAGLRNLLLSLRKSHLRFDGLILQNIVYGPSDFCIMLKGGEDIRLTRIFYDGRPPPGVSRSIYSPSFLEAAGVRDLVVKNCIGMYGFGASAVSHCPGFRMEHSLIVHNQIGGIRAGLSPRFMRGPDDAMVFRNNIFIDCQASKVDVEVSPSSHEGVRIENNAHFLQPQRRTERRRCMAEFAEEVAREGGILCDPRFAGLQSGKGNIIGRGGAIIGILDRPLTFADFFATHPEYVRRGIGLNPDDFNEQ